MAQAVNSLSKFASQNVQAIHGGKGKGSITTRTTEIGRRSGLLLSSVLAASQVSDSRTELLKKYLKKSEENKAKNDKERLDSFYKRNYKDYFEFVEGSLAGKEQLSESEKGILDWLKKNK
ncbi:hypothetical protein AAG906_012250 [Vitis piasezkii]|uniref:Uncharacterized protein n=2 Tax=Vitis vinifera TaxID=29760 RepID=A5C0N5_VITVI|eukprot:XP_002267727.1 PREDICTED: uncharacterized protein LOC100247999 [Vitis vinifera]